MAERVDREMEEMGLRQDGDVLVPSITDAEPTRTGPRENRFGDTIAKYTSGPLQEAWTRAMDAGQIDVDPDDPALITALKRANDYFGDMALAGLGVGEAGAKAVAASVGEVFGDVGGQGRSGEERLTEDLMAMPEAFAGAGISRGANMLDDVLDTGGDAVRYIGRTAKDRANQPGEVPVMGTNLGNVGRTAAPFDAQRGVSEELAPADSVYNRPAGSDPRYRGAAPDRSDMTYLRYRPKTETARVQKSMEALRDPNNETRKQMLADIQRGQQLGGDDWYNTEELRDWFVAELGEEAGDAEWREFMYLMGTTSPGSKVDANIGNASAVRRRLSADELIPGSNMTYRESNPDGFGSGPSGKESRDALTATETSADAQPLAKTREKGYGHKTGINQELNTSRYVRGEYAGEAEPGVAASQGSLKQNPKPKGFINSLLGNQRNIAADLHFTRYMAMASKDPEWLTTGADVSKDFKNRITREFPDAEKYFTERTVNGKPMPSFKAKSAVKDGAVPMKEIEAYPSVWAEKPNDSEYAAFEDFISEIGADLDMTPAQVQANLWMGAADRTGVDPSSQGTFMELLRKRADIQARKTGQTREDVIRQFIREKGLLQLVGAVPAAGLTASEDEDTGNFARGGLALSESHKGIKTQAGMDMADNKKQLDRKKADVDGDGELSDYEKQRGEAIQNAEMDDELVPEMACGGIMGDPMMTGMDPVSGNEIPVGATAENVRDDIPVNISQDEYVLPAHVVKYHGLKYIMDLQSEAEMGLMTMKMDGLIQTIGDEDEGAEEEPDGEGSEDAEVSEEGRDAEEGEGSEETLETPEGNEIEVAGVETTTTEFEDDETEEYEESAYPTKTKSTMYGMMKKPKVTFIV